jgi:flagellar basal-body rod protein FlgG
MNVSLYQAAAAMNANSRWQELISDNLADSSVPGARKQDVSFTAVEAGMVSNQVGLTGERFVMPAARASINFSQGEINPTGTATDFALDGPGFFQVQMPNEQMIYTRDGEFHVNAKGQLTTKRGYPIMSDSGGPVQLDPNNSAPMTVSASGQVSQGGEPKARIRLVEFKDPHALTVAGQGYYIPTQKGQKPEDAQSTSVRQGYIEGANTSPTVEMSSMITAMRMFESNEKVLSMQDERMGKVISDLGGTGS